LSRFVLDASVALAWFVDHPVARYAIQIKKALVQDSRAVVPALWHLELANGFAVAERRGILSAADVTQGVRDIEQLLTRAIESTAEFVSIRQALATARAFQLSAYDAVYLNVARRETLPLATLDRRLIAAARQAGVDLLS
jgi:predicted nucleic acid-binding protein